MKGVRPKKHLSQNFLIDPNVCRKVVHFAQIEQGDLILEIGSGLGALTYPLLEAGATVLAVEKDPELAASLTDHPNLTVLCEDIRNTAIPEGVKIVSNLPYHLTSPILEKLLQESQVNTLTLILQKEMKERLFAKPSTKNYSAFSLFFQYYTEGKVSFDISPTCFFPKPSVTSSCIHTQTKKPLLEDSAPFFTLTRRAFQQRRKMLKSSLKELIEPRIIEETLEEMEHSTKARPEELSLEEWLTFFRKQREKCR